MCGIYGIWHTDGQPVNPGKLQRATTRLRHRGPDDEGYLLVATRSGAVRRYTGPDSDARLSHPRIDQPGVAQADLALGFRRLAILDLSPAGHQPMASPDEANWIVFNGEIYNYIELREELRACGHRFRSGGDTEVILAAYHAWGEACLKRFNGMWACAIWDSRKRQLFLSRDRFGIKPLYYTWDGRTFSFASEIKALVGACGVPFAPDDHAVYRYLVGGRLPEPAAGATFFKAVRALPAGHAMTVDGGTPRERRYWRLSAEPGMGLEAAAAVEAYRELFSDALQLQLRSDVAVGTCLSGGVDSSSIVCMLNRMLQGNGRLSEQIGDRQKTFSAVYASDGAYNERPYIERVIAATGVERNLTFPTLERLLHDVEELVWHQDEPFQSTSIFAQWCVMSAVRERGVTVLLDGQGADESLAGYRPFEVYLGEQLRQGRISAALANLLAIQGRTGISPHALGGRALALQLPAAVARPLLRRFGAKRSDLSPIQPDFAAHHGHATTADWSPWGSYRTLQTHLRAELEAMSLPHLLRYEDRNSMAFGIEARVPFLDHRLVEFSFAGAAPWRIYQGWTKWVLRQAMEGIVPASISWRANKIGFETPEAEWMAQWLRTYPDCFADGAHSAAYLNMPAVRRATGDGTATKHDKCRLWRWINLELWLKLWQTTER